MKQQQNKTQRAALVAELEQAQAKYQAMKIELEGLQTIHNRSRDSFRQVTPRHGELLCTIGSAEQRVRSLEENIQHLDKVESYYQRCASSDEDSANARREMEAAEKQERELLARAAVLRARIEAIQAENAAAEENALAVEADAARAYASAISSGNAKDEQTALGKIEATRKGMSITKAKITGNVAVLNALTGEAEALEAQASAARNEAAEHRERMRDAMRHGLKARWDEAARALETIGREFMKCGGLSGLHDLHVPIFAPDAGSYISDRNLMKESGD